MYRDCTQCNIGTRVGNNLSPISVKNKNSVHMRKIIVKTIKIKNRRYLIRLYYLENR